MTIAADSLKMIFLIAEVDYAVKSGGLKPPEGSALAKRFGVSEEVLLRYESAKYAHDSLFKKQWHQARVEALLRMGERGELRGKYDTDKYLEELDAALSRIQEAALDNEITRELDDALTAIRAALDASSSSQDR